MPTEGFSPPYTHIADIYKHLMRYIDYDEWADYYFMLARKYAAPSPKILELASGSCLMSSRLADRLPEITATDISLPMLKASNDSAALERVCCDMRRLPFKTGFDLVISAFDSLNYILEEEGLSEVFSCANSVLNAGGVFSFDVSLELNSLKNTRFLNRKGKYNGIEYVQTSRYDKKQKIHSNGFTLKYPDGSEYFELHKERIYPFETWIALLIENGFNVRECFDAFTFDDVNAASQRVQFVAIKGANNAKF